MHDNLQEDLRELEFFVGTLGVSDQNYDHVVAVIQRNLDSGHPTVLGLAESLGIESQPQPATA